MNNIIEYIVNVLNFVVENFYQENIIIQLTWLCIPIFFICFCAILSMTLLIRYINRKKAKRRHFLTEKYRPLVVNYLTAETNLEKLNIANQLIKNTKHSFAKDILMDVVTSLGNNLSGIYLKKLRVLSKDLKLSNSAIKKLKSKYWHKKIKGIRELSSLGEHDILKIKLPRYLNHKNKLLRANAQNALLAIQGDDALAFLNTYKDDLYQWQQIEFFETIKRLNNPAFNHLETWLYSTNSSVNIFGVRVLTIFYYSKNKLRLITDLIEHPDSNVRAHILQLIKSFKIKNAFFHILNNYHNLYGYFDKKKMLDTLSALDIQDFRIHIMAEKMKLEEDHNHNILNITA